MLEAVGGVRFVSRVIWIKGILNTLLGAVHIVGTFTCEARKVAGSLVDLLCRRGLREGDRSAWRMAVLCSLFTTAMGMTGVTIYGVSPPLQLLSTGLVGLAVLTLSRSTYRERLS